MNIAEAIKKVALNMSLVTGQGMSPYSDDQIGNYLSNAHDMITTKYTWPEMVHTVTRTLDGVTGKFTVNIPPSEGITDYKQIKHVYSENVERELPIISGIINPLRTSSLLGYQPLSIVDDPNKRFFIRVLPLTTVGQVAVVASVKADFTDPETVIPIDDLLHIWIATWMYAEDDATNPAQAEKYLNLWQDRVLDLRSNVNQGPFAMNPFNGPLDQWLVVDP